MFAFYTVYVIAKKVESFVMKYYGVPIYTIVLYQPSIQNQHPIERALYRGKFLLFTEHFSGTGS